MGALHEIDPAVVDHRCADARASGSRASLVDPRACAGDRRHRHDRASGHEHGARGDEEPGRTTISSSRSISIRSSWCWRAVSAIARCVAACAIWRARRRSPTSCGVSSGRDPRMIEISKLIASVAATRTPVLVRGETGTGKEVVARAHSLQLAAAEEPFVAVNCTAVPEPLLESELFGHLRGAFTGASSDRKGRFELAGAGRSFSTRSATSAKPSRRSCSACCRTASSIRSAPSGRGALTARVIAATHRPLEQLVREGRVSRGPLLPAPRRRDRRSRRFVSAAATSGCSPRSCSHAQRHALHKPGAFIPEDVMRMLEAYDWPGNVRELENALTRALVLARTPALSREHFALDARERLTAPVSDDVRMTSRSPGSYARTWSACWRRRAATRRRRRAFSRISRQRLDRILNRDDDENNGANRTDERGET